MSAAGGCCWEPLAGPAGETQPSALGTRSRAPPCSAGPSPAEKQIPDGLGVPWACDQATKLPRGLSVLEDRTLSGPPAVGWAHAAAVVAGRRTRETGRPAAAEGASHENRLQGRRRPLRPRGRPALCRHLWFLCPDKQGKERLGPASHRSRTASGHPVKAGVPAACPSGGTGGRGGGPRSRGARPDTRAGPLAVSFCSGGEVGVTGLPRSASRYRFGPTVGARKGPATPVVVVGGSGKAAWGLTAAATGHGGRRRLCPVWTLAREPASAEEEPSARRTSRAAPRPPQSPPGGLVSGAATEPCVGAARGPPLSGAQRPSTPPGDSRL